MTRSASGGQERGDLVGERGADPGGEVEAGPGRAAGPAEEGVAALGDVDEGAGLLFAIV